MFFAAAHREWRLFIQNETGTFYGAAHNTTANPDDGYLQQETVDAIANLATAMASDRAAIAQLMSTVERLTAELVTVNAKLVTDFHKTTPARADVEGAAPEADPAPQNKPALFRKLGPKNKTWIRQSITVGCASPGAGTTA